MAALRFVSFTEEVMKAVKKMKFGRALLERKIWSLYYLNWVYLSSSSENWLFIAVLVMKTIKTEWFQHQNEYLKPNSKEPEELY